MQQLASFNINESGPSAGDSDRLNLTATESSGVSIDRGGDYLRRRNLHDPQISSIFISSPNSDGATGLVIGSPSKSFEHIGSLNGGSDEAGSGKLDAGLSRATVLLLLSAHLIRLLYFHGLVLEEQRPVPPIASAGLKLDEFITPTATSIPPLRTSALQWDLLGQSISMIVVQLMLLHSMMMLRRTQLKRQRKRTSDDGFSKHTSTDSLMSSIVGAESPESDSIISHSSPHGSKHNCNHNNSSIDNSNTIRSICETKSRRLSHDMTSHFHNLLSPRNILHKHSFLEYLELLFLSSMAVKLVFDYHWYPRYRMQVVERLKHTSICLESCLALPQMIRNYRNRTTEGLSVVMVGGWVAGDFFKLCYFLFGIIVSDDAEGTHNSVFALGCLISLSLDSIVGMQMACWYPEPWALQWQQRIMRSVRHWKANKDDDARESLLRNNEPMEDGLFASLLRAMFMW
eukprot:CAMPEP_0172565648 /NCGR_PEP_ID=MMETSP1067-20121228/109012_1 /TAXON_ID=265564 ORGANISM="Thalassiosira punctigera, Strain Tpunct2005C2" /NCGR_SAMPLE_ID=MMETSP1067 /ASSEMBLY_ACC=CAM_ASM_000444 /LENGTH=457 /DNA_ID=CAMNT_0013356585 /DNA_START=353 /DNA_END=1723 /DNA_ORIENTATION=+